MMIFHFQIIFLFVEEAKLANFRIVDAMFFLVLFASLYFF